MRFDSEYKDELVWQSWALHALPAAQLLNCKSLHKKLVNMTHLSNYRELLTEYNIQFKCYNMPQPHCAATVTHKVTKTLLQLSCTVWHAIYLQDRCYASVQCAGAWSWKHEVKGWKKRAVKMEWKKQEIAELKIECKHAVTWRALWKHWEKAKNQSRW